MEISKKKKIISSVVSLIALSAYSITNVGAATTKSFTVDNDTSNSNYSNDSNRYTHYSGTWGTYLNSGYNGDSRLRTSKTKAAYEWVWKGGLYSSKKVKWEASVYLANNNFTDPKAHYEIMQNSNMYIAMCSFNLNQNLAPNGFSDFGGTATPAVSNGDLHPWYAFVENSGLADVGTGADAFYTYFSCK